MTEPNALPAAQAAVDGASPARLDWRWVPALLVLIGAVGILRVLLREWVAWRMLAQREPVEDESLLEVLGGLAAGRTPIAKVRLSVCPGIHSPMALGRREIVLPERALTELNTRQVEALLAHEMAHLVRRDPLWLGACRVAVTLAWFQPLLRLSLGRLKEETELAADDWAAQRVGDGLGLAQCLEQVGKWLTDAPCPTSAAAMAESNSSLVGRVERLLSNPAKETRRSLLAISGALALGLGIFACAGPSIGSGGDQGTFDRTGADHSDFPEHQDAADPNSPTGAIYDRNFIRIEVAVSGNGETATFETEDGPFRSESQLEHWLASQLNAENQRGVQVVPATGAHVSKVFDAAIAAGYENIVYWGPVGAERKSWLPWYELGFQGIENGEVIVIGSAPITSVIQLDGDGTQNGNPSEPDNPVAVEQLKRIAETLRNGQAPGSPHPASNMLMVRVQPE
ncbi:MAG: M56 family metallopeptidase, partial [Planctomycetes bacterium]|nr:M56 family metallopeptidase [Planctomycetota bacterium]